MTTRHMKERPSQNSPRSWPRYGVEHPDPECLLTGDRIAGAVPDPHRPACLHRQISHAGTPRAPFVKGALSAYRSGHAYLIDSHDTVISSDQSQTVGKPLDQVSATLAAAIHGTNKGYFGQDAQRQHFVVGPIAVSSWRLVFILSADELFQPFTPAQRWGSWIALVGFVLMSLGMITLFIQALAGRVAAEDDHARQQAMLDTATDAFIGMDHRGTVVDWNMAASRLLGWRRAEAYGQSVAGLLDPPQLQQAHSAGLQTFLETGVTWLPPHPMIVTAQHRDGYDIPVEVTISRTHWRGTWRFLAFMRDITDRLEHERQLRQMALTDALTGLANRRAFMENLVQAHAQFTAGGAQLTVLYADVDQFKVIIDTFGHAGGDAILIQIAERVRTHFRAGDIVARLVRDEFAVICEDFSMRAERLVPELGGVGSSVALWATPGAAAGSCPWKLPSGDLAPAGLSTLTQPGGSTT